MSGALRNSSGLWRAHHFETHLHGVLFWASLDSATLMALLNLEAVQAIAEFWADFGQVHGAECADKTEAMASKMKQDR